MRAASAAAALIVALALSANLALRAPAAAQEAPLDVRVDVSPGVVTLGDRVRITVTVTHTKALLITADPPSRGESLIVLESIPPETTTLPGGELRTEIGFTVAAFDLGTQQAGEIRVFWLHNDGRSGELRVTPTAFEVQSALIGDGADLRPLKPQATFGDPPAAWLRPLIGGAVVLATALALAMGVVWWRRRTPEPEPPVEAPDVSAETAARRRLDELAASGALAAGDFEEFYGTLSIVMRGYLEDRFEFAATALTTPELEGRMTAEGVERWQARLAGGLLDRCDGAVYARRHPDPASADHDLTVAFEIVELSRGRRAAEVVAEVEGR